MLNHYTAVIQAGGKGTRLKSLTGDKIPKPLLALNGKPMIRWQIENLKACGVWRIIIIVGHLGEKIREYFGDGAELGVELSYIEETAPLGSAGALYDLKDRLGDRDFLLIFGDVMFDVDLERMVRFHEGHGSLATLLVHPNSHPYDSDLTVMDRDCRIVRFDSKENTRNYWYENCVNAGIYVLSGRLLSHMTEKRRCDLEKDLLAPLVETGQVYGYRTAEYVKDAGTVERFLSVSAAQARGLWNMKNRSNPQRCVFLDRDGTVNRYAGLISREEQLELEDHAAEAIKMINESGYLAILVTNQPVVARGMCSPEQVNEIHRKLQVLLGEEGAYLDDIVFCPHHPDRGYPEENPEYKIPCGCRKPSTGMIDQMVERYHIDRTASYMVGDSTIDIQTGVNGGLRTVLVHTGMAGRDGKYPVKADMEASDLLAAVKRILEQA
jgi:mannose-1-phosphate guanylyltransferase/phosphomannomutase